MLRKQLSGERRLPRGETAMVAVQSSIAEGTPTEGTDGYDSDGTGTPPPDGSAFPSPAPSAPPVGGVAATTAPPGGCGCVYRSSWCVASGRRGVHLRDAGGRARRARVSNISTRKYRLLRQVAPEIVSLSTLRPIVRPLNMRPIGRFLDDLTIRRRKHAQNRPGRLAAETFPGKSRK